MSKKEIQPGNIVTAIHLNLVERTLVFDVDGQSAVNLSLRSYGLTFEALGLSLTAGSQLGPIEEAQKTITLTGRLKAAPRPGRADRSGNPTAYARFAAHVEGQPEAHDYIATFHRHTAPLALRLRKEDELTIEGYPHESTGGRRLDTFSVVNLVRYPGSPDSRSRNQQSAR